MRDLMATFGRAEALIDELHHVYRNLRATTGSPPTDYVLYAEEFDILLRWAKSFYEVPVDLTDAQGDVRMFGMRIIRGASYEPPAGD